MAKQSMLPKSATDASAALIDMLGGPSVLAKQLGVTPWAVSKWRRRIPAERVLELESLGDFRVTRYQLRPDVYGTPECARRAADAQCHVSDRR